MDLFNTPELTCGIDEAGRGPWAGPVTAAAVILGAEHGIQGLTDSKKLSEKKRLTLEPLIKESALSWGLGWATAKEIDELNIRQATHLAMRRAVQALTVKPSYALIDGNDMPSGLGCKSETIVKGDLKEPAISAASILAKTARDRLLLEYDKTYPGYGFAGHKGYGTAAHSAALSQLGPCQIHRMSFAPVKKAAEQHQKLTAR